MADPLIEAGKGIRELIERTEAWRQEHKLRGKRGRIEAAACAIRLTALSDALRVVHKVLEEQP
jgi:hypothetical protein